MDKAFITKMCFLLTLSLVIPAVVQAEPVVAKQEPKKAVKKEKPGQKPEKKVTDIKEVPKARKQTRPAIVVKPKIKMKPIKIIRPRIKKP